MLAVIVANPGAAFASPMVMHVGQATVVLTLTPDPPVTGIERAVVTVTGASSQQLQTTRVSYSTTMPDMGMTGQAGAATPVLGKIGHWTFDLPMVMATTWRLSLHFDGGLTGTADYAFATTGGSQGMNGLSMSMTGGHEFAWRAAAIALTVLLALAALAAFAIARSNDERLRRRLISPTSLGLLAAALLVIVSVAILQARFAPPAMDMQGMSNVRGAGPVPVTLANVLAGDAGPQVRAPGVITPFLTEDIAARVPGIVAALSVYNGDRVRAGQTIGTLSEPDLGQQAVAAQAGAASDAAAAAAAAIEANHHAPNAVYIAGQDLAVKREQARYWREELNRERFLLGHGAVSAQEFENERAQAKAAFAAQAQAEKQLMDAQASVGMARSQQLSAQQRAASSAASASAQSIVAGYTSVIAPDDGVVVRRFVDPGSTVQAGTALVRLAVERKVRIQATVSDTDLRTLYVGAPMRATLPNGAVVNTHVTSLQPVADPSTHTATVEAIVDNPNGRLAPGTYVDVVFAGRSLKVPHAVEVPSAAVVGSTDLAVVWIDVAGAAHRVPVRVHHDDGALAVVTGDLKRGDRVIVEGAADMEEGLPVEQRGS